MVESELVVGRCRECAKGELGDEDGGKGRQTSDSCSVPFSRICLMTSSSTWVPNSLSSVPCEAPSNVPCAPCLLDRVST